MSRYWVVPPIWAGETCFILAGGPSLQGFRADRLKGCGRVLVINQSYQLAPGADCLYFCDARWWKVHGSQVRNLFTGSYIVTLENQIEGVKTLRNTGPIGLETDPGGLRTGSNSTYQAINLAVHFGIKRIVLLGVDMQVVDGRTHWHEPYPWEGTPEAFSKVLTQSMLPKFNTLVEPLQKAGVEVINATPGSALKCWSYVNLKDIR